MCRTPSGHRPIALLPTLLLLVGCAGGPLSLAVEANSNNVLSAVATLKATQRLSAVIITVRTDGSPDLSTPPVTVPAGSRPITVPILPLKARTTYALQASGKDGTATVMSNQVMFTTGALPDGLPSFTAAAGGAPSAGYTLVARMPTGAPKVDDLTIIDATGRPAWYYAASPSPAGDFQQQPDGSFTLAVIDPAHEIAGLGIESAVYRQIDVLGNTLHTWSALDAPAATPPLTVAGTDSHEIRIQPNGDALLFGLTTKTMDMTAYGGRTNATVVANVLERVTAAGEVSFAWNMFDAFDLANIDTAAATTNGPIVDFTHANAIDVTSDGNYLISLRNLSQIIKLDSSTGAILWKLGGTDGEFVFVGDPLAGFSCQHGARELPNGDIILFDDGDGHWPQQSRAVEYRLDMTARTATLVWSAEDSPALYSYVLGYAQRLTNGNTLVAYGTTLHVQEVDARGQVLWDLLDPTPAFGIYRAYRLDSLSPLALTEK
jgi:hypothetical protein